MKHMLWIFIPRNSTNGHVVIAGGVQEKELNTQTEHLSAMREKRAISIMIDGSVQDEGCVYEV